MLIYQKILTILFILKICLGHATNYQPWLGNFYEFELRSSCLYQSYLWSSVDRHSKDCHANNVFLNIGLSNAYPDPTIGFELELTQACTRKQRGDIDQIKFTGRYLWQDDIAGDPLSVLTGLNYTQAFYYSLRDMSSFHHGFSNIEGFISIGKENFDESLWGSRYWGVFAIGVAERGSPWLHLNLNYEKRWWEKHEMKLFLNSLWGLGHQRLHPNHFDGYGSIQHQSIDLGFCYTYLLKFYGSASLEYAYRVYAYNFPANAHSVIAQVLYTFGL